MLAPLRGASRLLVVVTLNPSFAPWWNTGCSLVLPMWSTYSYSSDETHKKRVSLSLCDTQNEFVGGQWSEFPTMAMGKSSSWAWSQYDATSNASGNDCQ